MRPKFRDYFISILQLATGYRTEGEKEIALERQQQVASHLDTARYQRVLDLANGRLQPQYSLLRSKGHIVFGIDLTNGPKKDLSDRGYKIARWLYNRHVRFWGLPSNGSRLICGDVGGLPFASNYFDLVTSVAAFEHFLDVSSVVAEIERVMRPGGLAYVRIHPFTCLSGGHNLKLMEIPLRTIPKGVDAWDHLRNQRLPITVPLNKWRIGQYLSVFSEHFEILNQYCAMREGEHLLTPEIEAELDEYTTDELTCGAYVIVARKSLNENSA